MRDLVMKSALKNQSNDSSAPVKIPSHWKRGANTNPNRTFAELEDNRKKAMKADPSFDLDGDGVVGNRDFLISKLFDKDGDGKLNIVERRNAEEAIRNVSEVFASFICPFLTTILSWLKLGNRQHDCFEQRRVQEH